VRFDELMDIVNSQHDQDADKIVQDIYKLFNGVQHKDKDYSDDVSIVVLKVL
jgi:hypothetical protein